MVQDRVQPLYSMASSLTHDSVLQKANTICYVHLLMSRPACDQALLSRLSLKLCEKCASNSCVRVFFIPWGHVNFYDHIWALWRHFGHLTYMLDSDWSIKFLLRSDWSVPKGAMFTTDAEDIFPHFHTSRPPELLDKDKEGMFPLFHDIRQRHWRHISTFPHFQSYYIN